jgi:uncharacterized protein YchJ
MKKLPFAYVLVLEHPNVETTVAACATLEEIEEALRASARATWVGLTDSEIVETYTENGWRVRIFACFAQRKGQSSIELVPFARTGVAA